MDQQTDEQSPETLEVSEQPTERDDSPCSHYYAVRFRAPETPCSAGSRIAGLRRGDVVMIQTDHGLEPAMVTAPGPDLRALAENHSGDATYLLVRRANSEEQDKFTRLTEREHDAFKLCHNHIKKHKLAMKLTRVERYFNGSKIIFYFTAENRVDFRELVKDLVQEFRTRVEIRQIGVRHETKMLGGLGCCGRELCCSSFIKDFAPVSIKMAKEQSLPLNPAKISGVCNRLLCCLTYEYETYHKLKKGMPKPGKTVMIDEVEYKVRQSDIFRGTITLSRIDDHEQQKILTRAEWEEFTNRIEKPRLPKPPPKPKKKSKPGPRGGSQGRSRSNSSDQEDE
ncbi:MAG: hypothetical protein KJ950_01260 [Proteobacteria bacterium]|nr:hypothetical protein [Pseudomonadota bacterium]MBU1686286.1 hypothetical protein [Pseudomonadota bacterium]